MTLTLTLTHPDPTLTLTKAREEDLFEMFTANFEAMKISDLPSAAGLTERRSPNPRP